MNVIIPTNKYQTPVTQELLDSLPSEVSELLIECLTNIQFIKNLISPDRLYYKDLPRDNDGKAIVDITNPPILEDADYFRLPALHFLKHGCYTFLRPNSNPNSEYRKFWDEERRRCWEGLVRESDGAWISGFNYWFLNYLPMMVNKITDGRKKAVRIEAFPFILEGNIWRYYYLYNAREEGHHAIELAKRGCAKSYSLAAIMGHNLILGESEESKRRVITVLTAYQKEYLSDSKDGTLAKFKPAINFSFDNTPFPHLMLKNSPNEMTWLMGYKDEYGIEKGSLNQVLAVSAKDDSEKLRGKRGWILFEEMGSFKGLLSLYDITRKSVEDGDYTFATMYLVGTAAEDESDFSSAKTLLYSPEGYNIKSLPNVYDRPKLGKATFGYFFPSYVNRAGCYNKDGVSDVVKALIEILMQRYKAKYSADPKSVLRVIAEDPITPAEAIIKVKSAFFPVTPLTERLSLLDTDPHAFDDVYVGKLVLNNNNEVEFRPTNDEPIRKYGVDNSTPGAIEIFEIPLKSKQGTVYPNRYIIGLDPVDNDLAESSSLSSTIVLDLWTDKIVAEYTGRLAFADDNFEITRLLCLFYNARVLAESNKKGWYSYFSKMNCTHLLAETPEYLREKQLVKYSNFGSNKYGVNASAAINNYANGLIRDWLLKPVNTIIKNELNEEQEVTLPNLYFLRNRALIEELIAFNPEINVDRCVLENTQILTYNGIKNILDITLNDKVITSSGTYENVILLHKNNFYGKIYSVRALGDYRTLLCTDNHPILVRTGKKCLGTQWIKLKNNLSLPYYKRVDLITELDRVLIPIRQNLEKCTIPDDLLYILGWYIADGNISSGNYVKFFLQEDLYDIGINIVNILNKYFKRDKTFFPATVDKNGRYISSFYNSQGVQARITHSKDKYKEQIKKMWVVEIASKDAKLFFSYYGGAPKNKDINEELYNKAGLLPLIQGYFEGDGHYRCEFRCDGVERNTLEVNTIYEKLAHKIRLILLDNKLWCTIRYISNKNKKNSKPLFNISLTNECVIPIIQNSLKFKHNIPKNKKTIKTHYVLKEDGFWVKLKDIDFEQKNITTYNISVDNNPSYVASGIVTHNCRALGMVMLYREEKMILYQGNPSKAREEINASYLGNDPFFTDNYNKRFGINSVNLRKNTETC